MITLAPKLLTSREVSGATVHLYIRNGSFSIECNGKVVATRTRKCEAIATLDYLCSDYMAMRIPAKANYVSTRDRALPGHSSLKRLY